MDLMDYQAVQKIAKDTINYIKAEIRSGMSLKKVRSLCETKMRELGADSFWYYDIGAFVFSGDETTISVSGREYSTSDRMIALDDIITIDLSPQVGNTWGDYARTVIIQNGEAVQSDEKKFQENCIGKSDEECKKSYVCNCLADKYDEEATDDCATDEYDVQDVKKCNAKADLRVFNSGFKDYVFFLPDYSATSLNYANYRVLARFQNKKDNNNYYSYATIEVGR